MPSEPNAINYLLSGALGAVISGFILLINNYVNNKSQSKREEEQRTWQLEREEQQRIWQEKSDQRKWYREKIYDCYRRGIQVLTKIIQEDIEIEYYDRNDEDNNVVTESQRINLVNLRWELYAELAIIEAGYPNKDSNELKNKITKLKQFITDKQPLAAQIIIIEIMEGDSRMKI